MKYLFVILSVFVTISSCSLFASPKSIVNIFIDGESFKFTHTSGFKLDSSNHCNFSVNGSNNNLFYYQNFTITLHSLSTGDFQSTEYGDKTCNVIYNTEGKTYYEYPDGICNFYVQVSVANESMIQGSFHGTIKDCDVDVLSRKPNKIITGSFTTYRE